LSENTGKEGQKKPVRITAPVWAALALDAEQPMVIHLRGKFCAGDIVSDGNYRFVVVGRAPRAKPDDIKASKVDHNEVLMSQALRSYAAYPEAQHLQEIGDFEEAVLRFRAVEVSREMEYSWVVLVEGGSNQPWQIDVLLPKRKFPENPLVSGKEYVAYGFFRWSSTGFLRFHPVTIAEWIQDGDESE